MKGTNKVGGRSKLFTQLWGFTKFLVVLGCMWLLGYHGLSVAWVGVISVFIYIWMFENHEFSLSFRQQQEIVGVSSEQISWLSKVFDHLWPYTKGNIETFMRNQMQKSIRKTLPSSLQSFLFTNIDLGVQVPHILGVEVKDSDKDYIIIDFELLYNSDAHIGLSIGKLESSIENIQIHGTLRVILTDLNSHWPHFGKMNISFVTAPSLNFRLAQAASILNVAGFRDIIHESIRDQLTNLLVLPHFLTIPVNSDYKASTAHPLPQGVLRVHVNRAKDLPRNDQRDSIDPYCVVQVGATRYESGVIQRTDHPMWNECFEFLVNDTHNQYVEVQCIDAADDNGIGSLGSCYVNVAALVESSGKNTWLTLDKSTGGSVNVTATWLQLSDDITNMSEPEMLGCRLKSVAVLTVGVESATSLPRALRSLSKPNCCVKLKLDRQEKYTKIVSGSDMPSWGENFCLLSSNPRKQSLLCEVVDDITDTVLGSLTLSLADLTETPNMPTKSYTLTGRVSDASLTLSLSLKALVAVESNPSKLKSDVEPPANSFVVPAVPQPSQVAVSTPARARGTPPLTARGDHDNESTGCHSDILDFDNWSETTSNGVITGGATYIVISRPDGATVSEIVQNADETVTCGKENVNFDNKQFGKIQITLRYSTTQQRLMVVIHQCCNLIPLKGDKETLPDPFVVLTLYNGRTKVDKKKTKHQKTTLNPVFDETFEFKLLKPNLENALVELSIKNKKKLLQKGKSSMGSVLLRIDALDLSEARTDWFLIRSIKESTDSLSDLTQSFTSRP